MDQQQQPARRALSRTDCIDILSREDATFVRYKTGTFDLDDPHDTDFSVPVVAAALERLRAEHPIADGVVADQDFAYEVEVAAYDAYIQDLNSRAEDY